MTAYSVLRVANGYGRWVVLVSALTVLVRAVIGVRARGEWTRRDEEAVRLFVSALDLLKFSSPSASRLDRRCIHPAVFIGHP